MSMEKTYKRGWNLGDTNFPGLILSLDSFSPLVKNKNFLDRMVRMRDIWITDTFNQSSVKFESVNLPHINFQSALLAERPKTLVLQIQVSRGCLSPRFESRSGHLYLRYNPLSLSWPIVVWGWFNCVTFFI